MLGEEKKGRADAPNLPAWRKLAAFDDLSESWSSKPLTEAEADDHHQSRLGEQKEPVEQIPRSSSQPESTSEEGSLLSEGDEREPTVSTPIKTPRDPLSKHAPAWKLQPIATSTPPPSAPQTRADRQESASPTSSDAKQSHVGERREDGKKGGKGANDSTPNVTHQTGGGHDVTALHISDASSLPPVLRPAWQDGSPAKEKAKAQHGGKLPPGFIAGGGNLFSPTKLQTMFRAPSPPSGDRGKAVRWDAQGAGGKEIPTADFTFARDPQRCLPGVLPPQTLRSSLHYAQNTYEQDPSSRELKRIRLDRAIADSPGRRMPSPSKSPARDYKSEAARLLRDMKQDIFGDETTTADASQTAGFAEVGSEVPGESRATTPRKAVSNRRTSYSENESPGKLLWRFSAASQKSSPIRPTIQKPGMVNIRPDDIVAEELDAMIGGKMAFDGGTKRWVKAPRLGGEVSESADPFAQMSVTVLPEDKAAEEGLHLSPSHAEGLAVSPSKVDLPRRSILKGPASTPRATPRRPALEAGNVSVSFLEPTPTKHAPIDNLNGRMANLAISEDEEDEDGGFSGYKKAGISRTSILRSSLASFDSYKQYLANRRATHGDETGWDATMRTEPSFAIADERVLQVLTDVVPWQPDWHNLSVLDISNRRVETLVKLHEYCPNLLDVNLNDNLLSYVTGLPKSVRHLQIARNRLSPIAVFSTLDDLQTLDVSENALGSLRNLSTTHTLRVLRVDKNELTSIDGIQDLPHLESISLQGNALEEIDFEQTEWNSIQHVSLSHNKLHTLRGLQSLGDLRSLTLDYNQVDRIQTDTGLHRLRLLRVSGNAKLRTIDISAMPKLRTLYADFCDLTEVKGLSQARRLENLSLRAQRSGKLSLRSPLPSRIRRLFISGNPMQDVLQSLMARTFNILDELVYLELAGCQLTSLPAGLWECMPNIRHLNLDHNLFETLPSISELQRLKRLSVVACRIGKTTEVVRAVKGLQLESLDTRLNLCNLGLYPPIPLPVILGAGTGAEPPSSVAATAAPFPHPANVQPDYAVKQFKEDEEDSEEVGNKSYFHKRLPEPPAAPGTAEQGVSQINMNEAIDERFASALPAASRRQRILHRGVIAMACPRLRYLDGRLIREEEVYEASSILQSV